uniref:ABC transporter substrate-binding protein n=1 Tax=Anaerococcus mediterraneensis TaxID=1870984 RepID=UPI000931F6CC|nr:ABC transporter substrate-binding protein [Anaerococcus mediterraneensis]
MFKKVASKLLVALMFLGLTACAGSKEAPAKSTDENKTASTDQVEKDDSQGSADKTTIVFWHSMGGNLNDAIDHLVEEYNNSQDKYQVKAQFQGEYDDALTKLRSSASGKDVGCDLVQVFDLGTRYMIDSGLIKPIQDFVDKENYDTSQLEENLLAYYTVDGKLNSMPFNSSTPLLYYNKDMFDKAGVEVPKSLEEMKETGKKLMDAGVTEMPISMSVYGWWVEQFMSKQGLDIFDNENGRKSNPTKTVFDENGGVTNVLKAWKDLKDMGIAPNVGKQGGDPEFKAGTSAMTFASTASLAQILSEVGDRFEVGTAYFPGVKASDKNGVSIGGASLYALDSGDEEKMKGTWDFIKFLVSVDSQTYWNANTGYFPVNKGVVDTDAFKELIKKSPQFETAIDQLHDSTPEDQGALATVFQESRQIIEKYIEEMLNDNISPEEASKKMSEEIDAALESYNKVNKK